MVPCVGPFGPLIVSGPVISCLAPDQGCLASQLDTTCEQLAPRDAPHQFSVLATTPRRRDHARSREGRRAVQFENSRSSATVSTSMPTKRRSQYVPAGNVAGSPASSASRARRYAFVNSCLR